MKKIYISGKISGLPIEQAKKKFEHVADVLREHGHRPFNPFDNGLPDTEPWDKHMRADIAMMMECDEVVMLPCWKDSRGAQIEHRIAKELDMPIVYL